LLTGKYKEPTTFETGDFRATVKEFTNQELIEKMQVNKEKLEEHFSDHPPTGDAWLGRCPFNGCAYGLCFIRTAECGPG